MEKDLDVTVIKATQSSLGKYVKRPPLTEKLLKKPPFRFLHDIVTSVLKTTGFFEGLFDEEELISENVKDRDSKLAFLNKVITVVGLTTGKTLAVKASKVVAGQEPDKTNELLQCIAHALDKNLSSNEAVNKFKGGLKLPKSEEKRIKDSTKQTKKPTEGLSSKSSEKLTNNKKELVVKKEPSKNDSEKTKTKQNKSSTKTDSPPKKTIQQSKLIASKKPSTEKKKKEDNGNLNLNIDGADKRSLLDSEIINNIDDDAKLGIVNQTRADPVESEINSETVEPIKQYDQDNSSTTVDNALNSSLSSQDLMETENAKTEEQFLTTEKVSEIINTGNTKTIDQNASSINIVDNDEQTDLFERRPSDSVQSQTKDINKDEDKSTADRSVVKSPSDVKIVTRPLSVRPSSSRPGAPRPRDKHDNIITETENILVGKVNIIVESSPNEEEDTSILVIDDSRDTNTIQDEQEQLQASLNDHGHLVQQILDSQKEYSQMSGKTEIEWQFGAKKARDALYKEIEQLRYDIQALSRVANPLGKVLDHMQEDVEVMRQELNQWTKTYDETSKELIKQKTANEESLFPLYTKVKQLATDIEEKHDKINDLKIIIHKNSHRIDKLLANGNVQ